MINICQICEKPNAWGLIDPIYELICGECVESEDVALSEHSSVFVMVLDCSGSGCSSKGPANFGRDLDQYYCGGSYRCCP